MKKIIAVGAATVMLAFTGATAAHADPYPVTQPTDTTASSPDQVDKGETARIRVRGNAQGTPENCTGQYVLTVKKAGKVVKQAAKPGDQGSARFAFTPKSRGDFRIIAKYRRGVNDPCGRSRDTSTLTAS